MQYLTIVDEIKEQIDQLTSFSILWLDTEIADWSTSHPRISLIQVSSQYNSINSADAYIFDVLEQPDLVSYFIHRIMINPAIEKVFHNASFDLRYLSKSSAQNVTCTLKIAQKIGKKTLTVSNLKLKTLAVELCQFRNVDQEEGMSDWGKRPLTQKQLQYAAMDTVYLAAVHRQLLEFSGQLHICESIYSDKMLANPQTSTGELKLDKLTPTKVRVAFECPRLFYLSHHFGGNTLFIPANNSFGIGRTFHFLANEFIKLALNEPLFINIFHPAVSQLKSEQVAAAMQKLFYERKFLIYLEKQIEKDVNLAQLLFQAWQALQGLIRRFADLLIINRAYCDAQSLIKNTFIEEEYKLEYDLSLPDGRTQKVMGEYDCLVFNCESKRLCVIEFKTYLPVDPSAQLAQVAIYSSMLSQQKKVAVDAAVYCVLPNFKEYQYSWEQLESTVHQLIPYKLQQMQEWLNWEPGNINPPPVTTQPDLCQICPQQQKCQTFFALPEPEQNSKPNLKTEYLVNDNQAVETVQRIGEDLVTTLLSFGIGVDFLEVALAPSFIRVKLKPHPGVKVNTLLKLSADLQVQLSLLNPPMIAPQTGYVSVDLPRSDRQVAKFEDYLKSQILPANSPVKIALGVNLEGKLIEADLSDPNTCHFLVGGTTGSGKSEFLRSLLLSLLVRHSPQHLQIVLVDPKRVTFPEFERMKWLYSPIVKDGDTAIALMESLVTEMENRYQVFEKVGCNDLGSFNQGSRTTLPRIVCIFDEYADFMAEKELRKALELSIKRLGAKARAAGIHLIIATQRPEATVLTPLIRSNLPGRVALKTASEADSMIILGGKQTAAGYLLGKGDLLYLDGASIHRLQSLFTTNIQIKNI
ncbi:DNA translocase FtsK [Brunnivagina elsteri]|uniref:Cell division protein FtsK n=1 Tax=Brunnivagina elsteri CCALA 953 TaxID=987040 RepID=A0A2A2TF46_9CYAN|nr:DNA translocase FtsK [Calothrix elsteri]PAX52380.1 cell division protein FtsK [Calothrix elsteri CCALA 953]